MSAKRFARKLRRSIMVSIRSGPLLSTVLGFVLA
jgi:hypothetical protein